MKCAFMFLAALIALAGCASPDRQPTAALAALAAITAKYAPDPHLALCHLQIEHRGQYWVLSGEVQNADAKADALASLAAQGIFPRDDVTTIPAPDLGEKNWGIATVSLLNLREKPGNPSEMGTQIFMGEPFRILKKQTNWFLIQSADHYLGWTEGGAFALCTSNQIRDWQNAHLLIVTAPDAQVFELPDASSLPVSDVVLGDRLHALSRVGAWDKVELADGRSGYLMDSCGTDFEVWKQTRQPTADNIERTAKSFLGRPYFWGCNSIRAVDCSGFTKLVFFLNGIDLERNASQQCRQGVEVPLGDDFSHLQKGDLLFFGHRARGHSPERIVHVAIYLGDRLFIQAAARVRINSLDPDSPLSDSKRLRTLLHARRILGEPLADPLAR